MRNASSRTLSAVLLIGLLIRSSAVLAGPKEIVGRIINSSGASLGGILVPSDGTIVTGDTLRTAKGGSALLSISPATQASLSEETTVSFAKDAGRLAAKLASGKLEVESSGKEAPVVETPLYRTEPVGGEKASYLVALLSDQRTVITSHRGKISIIEISTGRTYLLPEGYMATTADDSASTGGQEKEEPKQAPSVPAGQAGQPQETGTKAQSKKPSTAAIPKSRTTLIIVLAGAGIAGGVGAAVAAGGGGTTPPPPSSSSRP